MELNKYVTRLGRQELESTIYALNEAGYTVIQISQITPNVYDILAAALHLSPAEQEEVAKRRRATKTPDPHIYSYANEPLTQQIALDLIVEIFGDQGLVQTNEVVECITQTHRDRGGRDAEVTNVDSLIARALQALRDANLAENVRRGYWRILRNSNE